MPLLTNLVSYWKLDEASGTRNDSHGTNHLTDTNTVGSVSPGLLGGTAANFIAANSEDLSIADNATLAFTTALSASFWIRHTNLGNDRALLGKWTYQTDGEWVIETASAAGGGTGGDITIFLAHSAADAGNLCRMDFNDPDMVAATWYHLVVVYDGSLTGDANRLKLWVNGVQKTIGGGTGSVPATLRNGTATFYLGRWGGTLTRYFNGDMDEVGLWNRAITSGEVGLLYNGGAGFGYPFVTLIPQASPGVAPATVGHGQLGLASRLPVFADIVGLGSD